MTSPAAWTVFAVSLAFAAVVLFGGGWVLRGLWDRYRAEVGRDRARDDRGGDTGPECGGGRRPCREVGACARSPGRGQRRPRLGG